MRKIRISIIILTFLLAAGCSPSTFPTNEETPYIQPSAANSAAPKEEEDMKRPSERPDTFTNAKPFPTAGDYAVLPTLPSNKSEEERKKIMTELFKDILLNNLIVDSNGPQDRDNFRLVFEHSGDDGHVTVSESQGYGMMMLAYMAGSEEELALSADEWRNGSISLKDYYDAMLRTVIEFPSVSYPGTTLFAWKLLGAETDADGMGFTGEGAGKTAHFVKVSSGTSATDGDMDIIYSLLLADQQWGESTKFSGRSYKEIALDMLADLWKYCVHDQYHTLLLGDWAKRSGNAVLRDATRSSDFILSHLKAYQKADPAHDWQKVIDATYNVIRDIREAEAALGRDNGLLPDFIIRGENSWEVPAGYIMEASHDNAYAYNACRVPWRLGTDYMLFGDTAFGGTSLAEAVIRPIDEFAKDFSGGEPETLGPVHMDGTSLGWTDPGTFGASFLVTAAATGLDQSWIDAFYEGWTEWRDTGEAGWQPFASGIHDRGNNHYGDYIKLLAMIVANGYWWTPQ